MFKKLLTLLGIAFAIGVLAAAPARATTCAAGTTVATTAGPVCGIVVNGINEWLGIPFAAPRSGVCAGLRRSRTHLGARPLAHP